MRDYELVFIISPQIEDDQVPQVLEKIGGLVAGQGGSLGEFNPWGRRKMTYPIKRQVEGNYVIAKAKLDPGRVQELEGQLRLSEEILRHLVVRVE
ncbi:MAG: 30S ribosomal protein S6 [Chloroflexi bacterium]|nr:30S ribosomal protein S6 [Chloroflexota bacterium]